LSDLHQLETIGLKPNNFETYEHDNALERLLGFHNSTKVSLDFAISLFYKGTTGAFPRGRQTLMSLLYVKHLKEHEYSGKEHCEICGLPKSETTDKTHQLYTYYLGHSWNENPLSFLIELEEAQHFDKPEVTQADKQTLIDLLKFIALAEIDETPEKLEKRIASNKALPQTDKYKRYGILQTLAECGILPNKLISSKYDKFIPQTECWEASRKLTTSHRSDIVLPLGAWRGEYGVDWERYSEIFES